MRRLVGSLASVFVALAGCTSDPTPTDAATSSPDAASAPDAAELVTCPTELPTDGAACATAEEGLACTYTRTTDCGDESVTVTCAASGGSLVWGVPATDCVVDCRALADEAACEGIASCRWLVHGCDDGSVVWLDGCYAIADCVGPEDCREGEACTQVIAQPPPDADPKQCGTFAQICVDETL